MMDKEHADFAGALKLGARPPRDQRGPGRSCRSARPRRFHGIVDLIENKAFTFSGKGMEEKSTEVPIPDEHEGRGRGRARARLLEEAATGDEQLMEKFLGTGDLTVEEIRRGLCERVVQGDLVPAFCCSAYNNHGRARRCSTRSWTCCRRRSTCKPQRGVSQNGDRGRVQARPGRARGGAGVQDALRAAPRRPLADPRLLRARSSRARSC